MRPRAFPFAFSLLLHGVVLAWVAAGPVREAIRQRPSAYDMAIRGHEDHIVWFRPADRLPEISPIERHGPSRLPKAEVKAPQIIAATPPAAPKANQLVWIPAPRIKLKAEIPSPNLLAFQQLNTPAPPERPRVFAPPPQRPPDTRPAPELTPPPELAAKADLRGAPAARVPRPEPRAFQPRMPAPAPRPDRPVVPEAPRLAASAGTGLPGALPSPKRLAPRTFDPQIDTARRAAPPADLTAPPQVNANPSAKLTLPAGSGEVKPLPPRTFQPRFETARAGGGIAEAGAPPALSGVGQTGTPVPAGFGAVKPLPPQLAGPPPELAAAGSGSGSVSIAVVGLHPAGQPPAPPEGSRDARFSAGPVVRREGGDGEPVESARVFVPGLMVRNGPQASDPLLIARAPTSPENLRRILRETQSPAAPVAVAPVPEAPGAMARITAPPDPILAGRTVYGMTVQMPNVTSFTGSWLIWFAERGERQGAPAGVEAPVPLHKVDPKYVASAMADRVEGKVRLAAVILADGSVGPVMLLAHLDDRLDATAMEALGKWQFQPARRNGTPVAVDAVIEIPFRLAPRVVR